MKPRIMICGVISTDMLAMLRVLVEKKGFELVSSITSLDGKQIDPIVNLDMQEVEDQLEALARKMEAPVIDIRPMKEIEPQLTMPEYDAQPRAIDDRPFYQGLKRYNKGRSHRRRLTKDSYWQASP